VQAIVSRGGRPDLAGSALAEVYAPTLLLVGEDDPAILPLNQAALDALSGERELAIIPGASHLFEEPGALPLVAEVARHWFERHLCAQAEQPSL
jgi:pimeloyl-ACP methyl ester carboxylesterase